MRVFFSFTLCCLPAFAAAQELPKNLLLKCEGKVSSNITGTFTDRKFESNIKLQDGVLSNTDNVWLTTKGCQMKNSIISCQSELVVPTDIPGISSGSERRRLKAFLNRETGEYNLFLETWSYEGRNATGKLIGEMKARWNGACRPIGQPLF